MMRRVRKIRIGRQIMDSFLEFWVLFCEMQSWRVSAKEGHSLIFLLKSYSGCEIKVSHWKDKVVNRTRVLKLLGCSL